VPSSVIKVIIKYKKDIKDIVIKDVARIGPCFVIIDKTV